MAHNLEWLMHLGSSAVEMMADGTSQQQPAGLVDPGLAAAGNGSSHVIPQKQVHQQNHSAMGLKQRAPRQQDSAVQMTQLSGTAAASPLAVDDFADKHE
jgi:hypothetical protein